MSSSVNWALLGLVIERASYGWELASRFERSYGRVLPLSSESHIYKALDALKERGLVEIVAGGELGRQPKPRYAATELGASSYEEWLVAQIDVAERRQELWVRQLAIFVHDPVRALRVIDSFEDAYLKDAGQAGRPRAVSAEGGRGSVIDGLVAEQRRIEVGGMLSWLRHARERFEALAAGEAGER